MRKFHLLFAVLLLALPAFTAQARTNEGKNQDPLRRKNYIMVGLASQHMRLDGEKRLEYDSEAGVSFNFGHTFYLHKEPICNFMKVGLDWTYLSLSSAMYKTGNGIHIGLPVEGVPSDHDDDDDPGVYSVDIGMSVGPSLTMAPFYGAKNAARNLVGQTYFHVTPSYSAILAGEDESELDHGYATFFNVGANVAYKWISVGYEYRWGGANFDRLTVTDVDIDEDPTITIDNVSDRKVKFGTSVIYVRFVF